MKTINLYIAFLILSLGLCSCGNSSKENKTEETTVHKDTVEHHHAGNEVTLTDAQFNTAGVVLGTFSQKNLNQVVTASGYTRLPPQNRADVSAHMGGMVTSINVIEGQDVKKGQVLALLESPEFARLQEAYISGKSNLEYLKKEYERQKLLSDENVTSKKMFERTKSDYEMEQAKMASLNKQLSLLHLSKTKVTSAMPLVAPISGHVAAINITMGAHAQQGQTLVGIVDNTKLHADLMVYEKDINKIKKGQPITLELTNKDGTQLQAKVNDINKAFENDTKAVAVHADIDNKDEVLIAGMYLNALINVGEQKVQALPEEAVVQAGGSSYIFVLEEHDGNAYHFERVEVKTGTAQMGYVQVEPLEEIKPDAKIALKGAYYLQSHLEKSSGEGGHAH